MAFDDPADPRNDSLLELSQRQGKALIASTAPREPKHQPELDLAYAVCAFCGVIIIAIPLGLL